MDITTPHPIQEKILRRLGYDSRKTFSELQDDVPSNKFAFHLDQLQEKGMIEKKGDGYSLTPAGIEALPYLARENTERPVTMVDLFMHSGDRVYLEREDEADPLDATAGTIRSPSTRASKEEGLVDRAGELYTERFGEPVPSLELLAVIETTTRFDIGAEQHHLLFYIEAEAEAGEDWYAVDDMVGDEFLPGMKEVAEHLIGTDGVSHGAWELEYTSGELNLERLEFYN